MPEKGQSLDPIGGHVQVNARVNSVKGFLRQPDISGTVFDEQNFYWHTVTSIGTTADIHEFLSVPSREKRKVEPSPSLDSTAMLQPWRSAIFLQIARPMPVPANSSRLCSR